MDGQDRELHGQAVDGSSRGTCNYPSPDVARSHAHSAANLCPRPTTQLEARTRRAASCAATRRRGGYCTTRWSRCSFTTSAFIHATGRVRRGKVLRRGTGDAVGQGPGPWRRVAPQIDRHRVLGLRECTRRMSWAPTLLFYFHKYDLASRLHKLFLITFKVFKRVAVGPALLPPLTTESPTTHNCPALLPF